MTNLLLLTILAVLLFGAAAVTGFVGGIFFIVVVILVIGLLFAGIGWIFSLFKTNKDFRDIVWFFTWLGSIWYLSRIKMDTMAFTLLVVVPVIYLLNRVLEDVKLNGRKRVIDKYIKVMGRSLLSGLKLTLISVGIFVVLTVIMAIAFW